jgi:hypothetical protein
MIMKSDAKANSAKVEGFGGKDFGARLTSARRFRHAEDASEA